MVTNSSLVPSRFFFEFCIYCLKIAQFLGAINFDLGNRLNPFFQLKISDFSTCLKLICPIRKRLNSKLKIMAYEGHSSFLFKLSLYTMRFSLVDSYGCSIYPIFKAPKHCLKPLNNFIAFLGIFKT